MKFRSLLSITLLFCLATLPVLAQTEVSQPLIAIKAGKLLDPETGRTISNQIILVEGRQIKQIGGDVKIPANARVIDLSKSTVLPGLFDAHTHLCLTVQPQRDAGNYFFTTLLDTNAFRAIEGVANGQAMLQSGFTTVRDVGNAGNYADTALRRAIEKGIVQGPTMINAGVIIAPYGGQFHLQPEKRDLATPEYSFADTRDEMRKAIRQNIHFGATVIKIVVDDQQYIYSTDDIRFMIAEAHAAGLKLAAHCWTHAGAHNAAEAGVDSIEHGFQMTDEDLELAKKNNVTLVGTEFTEKLSSPEEHKIWVDRLKRAHKIGVNVVFGTDVDSAESGETRGTLAISYIDSWVDAGIPAADTIRAMTIGAARLLGVDKVRGALKPGLAADIIAVPENPVENIQTLRKVSFVMKDGTIVKQ
ncbi:MAG TPA: amidohydrolase family protein [Candidatus Saccharimonadales bacterium]|nr:amidohydrolase family protein [Candidatus Saccharimonadales bacterium]